MKAVIQRVTQATVIINGNAKSTIKKGLLILLGIEHTDDVEDITWLSTKIINLRIFNDTDGVMNVNLKDCNGDALIISQFTIHASTKKGNRPSYIKAAKPEIAIPLYNKFLQVFEHNLGKSIFTGEFGADMQVELTNDGPVTIIIDSKNQY